MIENTRSIPLAFLAANPRVGGCTAATTTVVPRLFGFLETTVVADRGGVCEPKGAGLYAIS